MKFDTPEWQDERDRRLAAWMCGNTHAVDYLICVFHIGEIWDDLIDKDKPVTDEQINHAFVMALFDVAGNPFFARNADFLRPVMLMGMNAWMDSAEYERQGDPHWLSHAFVLRSWYMELVAVCAFLTGGYPHMRQVGKEARAFFQTETLDSYIHEHYCG